MSLPPRLVVVRNHNSALNSELTGTVRVELTRPSELPENCEYPVGDSTTPLGEPALTPEPKVGALLPAQSSALLPSG